MKGAKYNVATHPEAPRFCIVEGRSAKIWKNPASTNPYPRNSPEWRCWRWGHTLPLTNVSRGTVSGDVRGALYSESELWFLKWAGDNLTAVEIAGILNRSHQAVRCKLHRMRREKQACTIEGT